MGGGRLVILPKKSYCPWKPENVERVLRDERIERERLERTTKTTRITIQLDALKKSGPKEQQQQQQGHVNLFEAEELDHLQNTTAGVTLPKQTRIMPVMLGQFKMKEEAKPFYLKAPPQSTAPASSSLTSAEVSTTTNKSHDRIDPMKSYAASAKKSHRVTGKEEVKRKKKKTKHAQRETTSNNAAMMEELRRRRREREANESQRAHELLCEK